MTKYLITASLINAYQYYINDEYKSPADSRADFLKTLKKESFEPNEAMQRGIDFENDILEATKNDCIPNIYKIKPRFIKSIKTDLGNLTVTEHDNLRNAVKQYYSCVENLAMIVENGLWQTKCQKELTIGNQIFLLYGKPDVIKIDTIYDIKFTSNYELGKFYNSIQHLIYLYCLDMPKFAYLISDGKEWWREDYFNNNNVENEIKSKITDFLNYLENDLEAKEIFNNKWKTN